MVPVPVLEPILPPTDLSLLPSDQENILLRMVILPPFTGGKGPNNQWAHAEYIEHRVNK